MYDSYHELRKYLDGSDPFMTGGHQVRKPRRPKRKCPHWALDDNSLRAILLRKFPNMDTDEVVRYRAGIWAEIVVQYHRMGLTAREVAGSFKDLNARKIGWNRRYLRSQRHGRAISPDYVYRVIQQAKFIVEGLRTDGKPPTGRKPGRPRGKTHLRKHD